MQIKPPRTLNQAHQSTSMLGDRLCECMRRRAQTQYLILLRLVREVAQAIGGEVSVGSGRATCREIETVRSPSPNSKICFTLLTFKKKIIIKNKVVNYSERKRQRKEKTQDSCDNLALASFHLASATFTLAAQTHPPTTCFFFLFVPFARNICHSCKRFRV